MVRVLWSSLPSSSVQGIVQQPDLCIQVSKQASTVLSQRLLFFQLLSREAGRPTEPRFKLESASYRVLYVK